MCKKAMKTLSLFSWNVNGIRAAYRRGFLSWLSEVRPDILCLQETRVKLSQLNDSLAKPLNYYVYWNSAEKKGYGGTALFSRKKPIAVKYGFGNKTLDKEGRTIVAEFPNFTLINCYFPNGNRNHERLLFKLQFYEDFLTKCKKLRDKGHKIIFCGDLNTAHREIDLAKPKNNKNKSGFLPPERKWISKVIKNGYIDAFRHIYPFSSGQYTWWSYRKNSRKQNMGWRFDYFFVDKEEINRVTDASIFPEVVCSDHCPIKIQIES